MWVSQKIYELPTFEKKSRSMSVNNVFWLLGKDGFKQIHLDLFNPLVYKGKATIRSIFEETLLKNIMTLNIKEKDHV